MKHKFIAATVAIALLAVGPMTRAQHYPDRPIHLVVPFARDGTTDIIARIVAARLATSLGQSIVVENKAGGGGLVGALKVIKAPADGYVLGMATVSTTAANPALNPAIGYNPITDFTPIINIAATPNVIAVHPSFPATGYAGFVAELKSKPGKYSFASSGKGSIGHVQMELFQSVSGTSLTHIPYSGAGPALNSASTGHVPIVFDNLPSALPFIRQGRLIPIVVAAPSRLATLSKVPTFEEVGLPALNRMAYYGILGPKNLPLHVVNKISLAVGVALADPSIKNQIENTGAIVVGNSPEQFATQIKTEFEAYRRAVQQNQLKLEQ